MSADKFHLDEIGSFLQEAVSRNPVLASRILSEILSSKDDVSAYEYTVGSDKWVVLDGKTFKFTVNATTHEYRCFFSKTTGLNVRFGETVMDDPKWCALGPEIMDLEVSVNGCVPVKGSSVCEYCYKSNTGAPPVNMPFDKFKQIVDSFPKNLSQIAFGITSLHANPDLPRMLEYCREVGIIPNLTTTGSDMDESAKDFLCRYCGAVAVSCYPGAKDLCYRTIKYLHDHAAEKYGRDFHVNMHIVLSKDNYGHLKDVLDDIAAGKVDGLRSIVLLRIKPVGRASKMDCAVPKEMYEEVVKYFLDKNISFGFDSCSATPVMEVVSGMGREELCSSAEPCESGLLSCYVNGKGEYWHCSFCERSNFLKPVNVLDYKSATEWWNSDELNRVRNLGKWACKSCPVFNLDGE